MTAAGCDEERAAAAARELVRQHRAKERFAALPPPWAVDDETFAYAVQDRLVRELERLRGTRTCGYKIVGFDVDSLGSVSVRVA